MSGYIDIHILQTVPPSNLNRDDTGSPKSAVYGGVRRSRVSSQAWKRATRKAFEGIIDTKELGVRTKRVVELISQRITEKAPDITEPLEVASKAVQATGVKVSKPKARKNADDTNPGPEQSEYLLFLSDHQIDRLAQLAIEAARAGTSIDAKQARAAADEGHSVDVSLFGRMVADSADLNVDAAAQVAHALSVHAVENEFDYFTAVDDRASEDSTGAGMIGTVEFNSATLYRYATVNVAALKKNLGSHDATVKAVRAFVRAFVTSMPTGKQNTFANRTLPDAVVVRIREDQPVNLVGAFEDPVERRGDLSRRAVACTRLVEYTNSIDSAFGAGVATHVVRVGADTAALDELAEQISLDELVTRTGDAVTDLMAVTA